MKTLIRNFFWNILGKNYYVFLKKQNKVFIDKASNVEIGFKTYNNGAYVWGWDKTSTLKIGKYCSIANDVNFILDDGFHLISEITNYPHFNYIHSNDINLSDDLTEFKKKMSSKKNSIIVGNDVWIGMNCTILPGVTIGNGVTVMAGAVVSKNVPDYSIVSGVPATVLRMKYNQQNIDDLQKISWWDWPNEKVEQNWKDFYLPLDEFINKWKDY